jgi:hemolysin activation/secretion protein
MAIPQRTGNDLRGFCFNLVTSLSAARHTFSLASAGAFSEATLMMSISQPAFRHFYALPAVVFWRAFFLMLFFCACMQDGNLNLFAEEPGASADGGATEAAAPHYFVQSYVVEGNVALDTNSLATLLSRHAGTSISVAEMVEAASDVQEECRKAGHPAVSVAIAEKRITNGIVPLYLFQSVTPQILISGRRYYSSRENAEMAAKTKIVEAAANTTTTNTNNPPAAKARTGPKFNVSTYRVIGNTLLSPNTIKSAIGSHMGTNVVVEDILEAGSDLQKEYRDRGFPTVNVTIPPQQISNGVVKLRVFEGRLSEIKVPHNHYFSSNNVMRSMPSLRTNVVLNGQVFQAELNRANANQDRQIYPKIEPGPEENTTVLDLDVKDRIPLHAKVELNNQKSPGTPELRVNGSAVYDNLWQDENSLGLQYSFSPERYKNPDKWDFFDEPVVANYSGFYRIPLGGPESLEKQIETRPGTFGYSEATRKFTLPPASGQPEINFYASRSTIDTGLTTLSDHPVANIGGTTNVPGFISIREKDVQEDFTVNQDVGSRLMVPLQSTENFQSSISGGLDYKTYDLVSYKTNNFFFSITTVNNQGITNHVNSQVSSPVPTTDRPLNYLPLSAHYDASLRDTFGITTFGLGASGNLWYSGSAANLHNVTGSTQSTGHWFVLTPALSRDFNFHTNWTLTLRADGQWADQPLVSTEQFGAGGVNSVRGYHEGEVFGDNGWHVSLEQKTPPYAVGYVSANNPLIVRGSVYMDYAETFLLDPQGQPGRTSLWGVGIGAVASIGPHFEARFLFSVPLTRTATITPYQPFFSFALNAQF